MMLPPTPAKIRDIARRSMALAASPPYAPNHNGSPLLSASGVPGAALIVGRLRGKQAILATRASPVGHQARGVRKPWWLVSKRRQGWQRNKESRLLWPAFSLVLQGRLHGSAIALNACHHVRCHRALASGVSRCLGFG